MRDRNTAATLLAAALGTVLILAPRAAAAITADYDRTPVLFLHGYFVIRDAGTFTWATMKKNLIEDGWPEEYIATPSFEDVRGCNEDHITEIETWVEKLRKDTGSERIDIVCHSFGCLNTLSWLKAKCGVNRVRQYVGLAGAVHGTLVACADALLKISCAGEQMCIGTGEDGWKDNELIANANACDETPGDVQYTSVWSDYDEIIRPPSGSEMAGARNIEVATKWVEHGGIFLCDECYGHLRTALLEGGANDDGPSWPCLPDCIPPEVADPVPEDVPDSTGDAPDLPDGDEAIQPADEAPDALTPDVPEIATDPGPVTDEAEDLPEGEGPDALSPDVPEIATDPGRLADEDTDLPADYGTLAEATLPDQPAVDNGGPAKRGSGCGAGATAEGPGGFLQGLACLLLMALARRRDRPGNGDSTRFPRGQP